MDTPNYQFPAEAEFKALDRGTPAWAVKPGPDAVPEIPLVPGSTVLKEDFEGTLWQQIDLVSNTGWFVTSADAQSGTKSFESANVGGDVTSSLVVNDFSFSDQLSFWIKADVVPSAGDIFEVKFDGVPVYTLTEDIPVWTRIAIPTNFAFNIEFRFFQDFPTATPFVRLDNIVFGSLDTPGVPGAPAHPLIYTPLRLDENDNLCVKGTVSVDNEIEIKNDTGNPIPVSDAGGSLTVDGTVNIGTMPEVEVKNDSGNPVPVSGTVSATQGTSPWETSESWAAGTLQNGTETAVGASAVEVLAANSARKKLIIQNVGVGDVRVGVSGVTATTGLRLVRNGHLVMDMPHCPTQAIFAIREGGVSSTVLAQEVV